MVSNGSDRRPLIGLTTYLERAQCLVWDSDFALLPQKYVDAVTQAGGVPVLLPPAEHGADEVIAALDGLVLTGGADLDPARYGQQPHTETRGTRPGRDVWEERLLERALARDLPTLGVCRGAQLLNVALGGSLKQHLPDAVGHEAHRPGPGVFGSSRVRLRDGSRTAGILGTEREVACYHHQALDRIAPGLAVAGWAEDGTVEAVELPGKRFVLAVQWHPEQDTSDLRLFEALVVAAAHPNAQHERADHDDI